MQLNLPIMDKIKDSEHILIAGMGGGYDVFSGLPLYFTLMEQGYDVHLANFSFSNVASLTDGEHLTDTCVGVSVDNNDIDGVFPYFPEYFLAEWFLDAHNDYIIVWAFHKTGARPYIEGYRELVDHLDIDCIILVDGGADSLMHGNEPNMGTLFEDTLSLIAVNELTDVPVRLTCCLGLGVEYEIGYAHLFENIANLMKQDAFFGTCSLTKQMQAYQEFEEAALFVFDRQPSYTSVICSSIISAVRGEYGDYHLTKKTDGSTLRISPLMPTYWFFDLQTVVKNNLYREIMKPSISLEDAWIRMQIARRAFPPRDEPLSPLH